MALSASWQDTGPAAAGRGEFASRRRAFQAARRHSRLVRFLRIFLPVSGLVAVAAFVVATHFALPGDIDLSAARLSVTRNAIIMDSPHLTGFDGDRREYSVAADRAIQSLARPDQVRLEAIEATVTAAGRGVSRIAAEAGDYDHGKKTLRLEGVIAIDSAEGYALRMTGAEIDFEAGTLASPNPVTVTYENSTVSGDRMSVTDGGDRLVFEGGVRTVLMPPKRGAEGPAGE